MTVQASLPNLAFLLLTKIFDLIVQKKNQKKTKGSQNFSQVFSGTWTKSFCKHFPLE